MLEIKYLPIDSIEPYKNNSRKHTKEQISQIKQSIKAFGLNTAIGVRDGVIVYGHARYEALKELGYKEIPTVDLSHLSDDDMKAYVIADNKIALNANFDNDLLKIEFDALKDAGFDITLTGFDLPEIEALTPIVLEPSEPKDKEPSYIACPHCGKEFDKNA